MALTPEEMANRLPNAVASHREQLLARVTFAVEASVKDYTPVRTGTLRRSITSRVEAAKDRGVVGTAVHYARFVNRWARFMEFGLDAAGPAIARILEDEGARIFGELQ